MQYVDGTGRRRSTSEYWTGDEEPAAVVEYVAASRRQA
jgi:hypothetical protein